MGDAERWYLAWSPGWPFAVLRPKDDAGLAEWKRRRWRHFPESPRIEDATEEVGRLLAEIWFQGLPEDGNAPWGLFLRLDNGRPRLTVEEAPPVEPSVVGAVKCAAVLLQIRARLRGPGAPAWFERMVPAQLRPVADEPVAQGEHLAAVEPRSGDGAGRVAPAEDPAEAEFRALEDAHPGRRVTVARTLNRKEDVMT